MTQRQWIALPSTVRYIRVSHTMMGLCHSFVPLGKNRLERTGASSMENISAPSSAKATVQAIGLKSRPSTCCKVKIGRYAVMMMPIA